LDVIKHRVLVFRDNAQAVKVDADFAHIIGGDVFGVQVCHGYSLPAALK
jgi:hypothetical protein